MLVLAEALTFAHQAQIVPISKQPQNVNIDCQSLVPHSLTSTPWKPDQAQKTDASRHCFDSTGYACD